MDEEDFFNEFLNNLINDADLIKCTELQSMINFCCENYDNWKDIILEYSVQIEKDTELQFDITSFQLNGDVLYLKSVANKDPLNLKDLENYLNELRIKRENDWGNILVMCDNDIEVNGEINQLPISTFVDEEDFVFSFIL
jgi:hypothetical protein